jgi:hypothetical protein
MMRCLRMCIWMVLLCSQYAGISQQLKDTSFVVTAAANAVKKYSEFIQGQNGLYIGSEYSTPDRTNDQHPFYKEFDWQPGNVFYNGEYYTNISFLYDLTSDNLVTEHFYNGDEIVLVKAKIERFTIDGDEFIHLNGTGLLPGLPAPGFYQLHYDGKSRVIARHFKLMEEKIEGNKIEKHFVLKSRYYVLHNGEYHKVSKRGEIFKVFADQKQALRSWAAKEKIKISKRNPGSFALVAQHYDLLNTPKP